MAKKIIKNPSRLPSKRLTAEEAFWKEVDQLSQEKIYQLLTRSLPLANLNLITEPYRYENQQQKLTGLFLHKDVDYRSLLNELESQWVFGEYEGEERPSQEYLAEQITLEYYRLVFKALISDLSEFASYDASYFENLTE